MSRIRRFLVIEIISVLLIPWSRPSYEDLEIYACDTKKCMILASLTAAIFAGTLLALLVKCLIQMGSHEGSLVENVFSPYDYVVNTPSCRIPRYHPYREDIQSFNAGRNYTISDNAGSCGSLPLLSYISRTGQTHVLHLNKQYMPNYTTAYETFTCCYSYIFSSTAHAGKPILTPCIEFNDTVNLDSDFNFLRVTCGDNQSSVTPPMNAYEHFHAYASFKREVTVKLEGYNQSIQQSPERKSWSVMIIGIGSMSRFNLMRMMPETAEYLKYSGWISIDGYSKVGDDTFSNLAAAVLAGSTEEQLRNSCIPETSCFVDGCPWIWRKFSTQGYITAYGEDSSKRDTFHLKTRGFKQPPTDYFLKTLLNAADVDAKRDKSKNSSQYDDCVGKIHASKHILKFSLQFADVFREHPSFSVFWLNPFSHDRLYGPKDMDEEFRNYLVNMMLVMSASRNNMVLIFMSDHGMPHRHRDMSFTQTNLPFMYIWLPEDFKQLNPKATENLIANKGKLTSHFDLHLTLLDLLGDDSKAPGCPTCVSLFKPVPVTRTCSQAGISQRNCACIKYSEVSNSSKMYRDLGGFLISRLNVIFEQLQKDLLYQHYKCDNFSITRTVSVRRVASKFDDTFIEESTGETTDQFFIISIETQPRALIEAMIRYKNNSMHIIDSLLRLDSITSGTRCMDHLMYKVENVKAVFT